MIDKERIIKGLECCTTNGRPSCEKCYQEGPGFGIACRQGLMLDALELLKEHESLIRCKDCKYYAVENYYTNFCGYEVLAASNVPTCHRWGDEACMVNPNGYCYLAERAVKWDE